MDTMPKVYLVLFLVAVAVALCLILQPARVLPANRAVTEYVFDEIREGGSMDHVKSLLGEPHEVTWGEIVRAANLDGPGYTWRIRRIADRGTGSRDTDYQGVLHLYRGEELESIKVLAWDGQVIAAEHCIDDVGAWLKGPKTMVCPAADSFAGRAAHNWWEEDEHPRWRRYQALVAFYRSRYGAVIAAPAPAPVATAGPADSPPSMTVATEREPRPPVMSRTLEDPQSSAPAAVPENMHRADDGSLREWRLVRMPDGTDQLRRAVPRAISRIDIALPAGWQSQLMGDMASILVAQHDTTGQITAAVHHQRGSLQGVAIGLHENGSLATHLNYLGGVISGQLLNWDDQGRVRIFANYAKGSPHGLVAHFVEGVPVAVIDYYGGDARERFLVAQSLNTDGELPGVAERNLGLEDRRELEDHCLALQAALEEIAQQDRELRAAVREAFEELKRAKASRLSAEARNRIQLRQAYLRWQNASALRTSLQSALGRTMNVR